MTYWNTVCVALAATIICLSFAPSVRRHRVAVICYTLIAVGNGGMEVFPMFFGINMANAFGPRPVPLLAYVSPILRFAVFMVPALLLYSWVSPSRGRMIVILLFGLVVVLSIGSVIVSLVQWPSNSSSSYWYGLLALFYLLLWLRVHEMRRSLEASG